MRGLDWLLLVGGTAVGVVSLMADPLAIGGHPGFGMKQATGTAAGIVLVAARAVRIVRRDRSAGP